MHDLPPDALTPFVFSDPAGKRWPRLRLILLVGGVLFFLGTVLFVQTLFVAPQMQVPFALRQLKGQLKALQKENSAGQRNLLRRARAKNLWATKSGSPSTPTAILTVMRRSSSMRRKLPISARSGWR